MTTHTNRFRPLDRGLLAIAALGALVLTGCSSGEVAEFEEPTPASDGGGDDAAASSDDSEATGDDASEETAAPVLEAESGLVQEGISREAAVLDTLRPERGSVITPAGTLTVEEAEVVESVPATEVGLTGAQEGDLAQPAEGEEFRILTMNFTPDQATQGYGDEVLDVDAALALNVSGVQSHLHDLTEQQDLRILFSVPQGGDGTLTVSSEGHDQSIDLLTGERVEDEIAAGYYREVTNQDLNHTFEMDDSRVPFKQENGPEEEYEATVEYDLRVNSVSLTAWTPQEGWAAAGESWLVVNWAYEISGDSGVGGIGTDINDIDVTLTTTVREQTLEDSVKDEGGRRNNSAEAVTVLAVPIGTVDAQLSLTGTAEYELSSATNHTITDENAAHLEFATDSLEVSFPDSRHDGAVGGQDDQPQEDDVEETDAPGEQDDA
ncbi:hypothetical protein [Ornithinimicrobium faecis]|uniref:hypothetical protein n=1 Tax=Ornithinimicrobium faecis TaxID=2934158 RepID=UPI0021185DA3|nr:hypothetical protein [Ornithinimicrobium sp. HY1745]